MLRLFREYKTWSSYVPILQARFTFAALLPRTRFACFVPVNFFPRMSCIKHSGTSYPVRVREPENCEAENYRVLSSASTPVLPGDHVTDTYLARGDNPLHTEER